MEKPQLTIACDTDAVGMVAKMPSGPDPIPKERISELADTVLAGHTSDQSKKRQLLVSDLSTATH